MVSAFCLLFIQSQPLLFGVIQPTFRMGFLTSTNLTQIIPPRHDQKLVSIVILNFKKLTVKQGLPQHLFCLKFQKYGCENNIVFISSIQIILFNTKISTSIHFPTNSKNFIFLPKKYLTCKRTKNSHIVTHPHLFIVGSILAGSSFITAC